MSTTPEPRLRFDGVTVDFGVTRALDDFTASFAPGEIVGLLGHNGAGKSTLLNVATGAVRSTAGEMIIDGVPVAHGSSPKEIAALGVAVIHQTPALAGNLSILDNLWIGRPWTGSRAERAERARAALDRVGGEDLPLDAHVGALPLGQRQVVDLARGLLAGEMKVLLLDEPTAALGQAETDSLHALIRTLAASGTTVIYVSHRLPDILEVCGRVVVMREGRLVSESPVAGLTGGALARALAPEMVERERIATTPADVVMRSTAPYELEFRAGEVVGLFGVAAGPQFALLEAWHGNGGETETTLAGAPYAPRSPHAAIAASVHSVPADRDRDGLVGGMSAIDNVFLPWRGRRVDGRAVTGSPKRMREVYDRAREVLGILGPGADSPISSFSGGNRQKHLLASWLFPTTPKVLLLSQPTQGVDVAAKADIRAAVRTAAAAGTCVVVASAESDEIASLVDRAYVLVDGAAATVERSDDFDADLLQTLLDLIPAKGPSA